MENVARKPRHAFVSLWKLISSNRGINGPGVGSQGYAFVSSRNLSHTSILYYYYNIYIIQIYEDWKQIASSSKN